MNTRRNQYAYSVMTTTSRGDPAQPVGLFLGADAFEAMADAHAQHPELDDVQLMARRYRHMLLNGDTQS